MGITYFINWCDKLGYHLPTKAIRGMHRNGDDSFRPDIFVSTAIYDSLQNRISHFIEWYSRIYRGWSSLIHISTNRRMIRLPKSSRLRKSVVKE